MFSSIFCSFPCNSQIIIGIGFEKCIYLFSSLEKKGAVSLKVGMSKDTLGLAWVSVLLFALLETKRVY